MALSPAVMLGLAYVRYQKLRCTLLVLGIALVVAVPVLTAAEARSVSAQAIRQAIAAIPVTSRSVLVSQEATSTFRIGTPADADRRVRGQLARLSAAPVVGMIIFRELTARGQTFHLAAADHLASAIRLTTGRLPRNCTASRCEVVAIGGDRAALSAAGATLGLVVVGAAQRRDPLLVSGQLDPDGEPVLVGASVAALSRLSSLQLYARYYAWVTALDPDRVVDLGVARYIGLGADVDHALDQTVGATTLTRPDDVLQQAGDRASASARRLELLGGFGAALLLGFAVVAGVGLRRDAAVLLTVVRRRGGTTAAALAVVGVATAVCTFAGVVVGALVGGVAAAMRRAGTGMSPVQAAAHALGGAATIAVGYALLAGVVVLAVLLWPDSRAAAVWRTVDLLAVAALAAIVLAASRGAASTSSVAGGDPLVVALPALTCVVAGLVGARLWPPLATALHRLAPSRATATRVALLGSQRRPLRGAATCAFLTAAVTAVVFAGAYRATLLAGDADEAAFQVPLDTTLAGSSRAPVPSAVVDPTAIRAAGGEAYGVLRGQATVVRLAGVSDEVTVLAVDQGALRRAHRWSRTSGGPSAGRVADLLGAPVPVAAPTIPPGSRQLQLTARGVDPQTVLTLWVRTRDGGEVGVQLHGTSRTLLGTLPAHRGTLRAVAFSVDEAPDYATHHAHAVGEGRTDQPVLSGQITLGTVRADRTVVPWDWSSWGSAQGRVHPTRDTLTLSYALTGDPAVAVAGFAALGNVEIPVAVDRATAQDATGGTLPFLLDGTTRFTGRIVATLPRMPTVTGQFLLVNRAVLQQALDLRRPGRAPSEFWVSGSSHALAELLATRPYDALSISRRADVQASLDADPVGQGSRLLLVVLALLSLGVAAVSLVLLVVGERRDGAGELYAWEADGMAPQALRRVLLLRALVVAAIAVPVGVGAGLAIARAGAHLVSVDALGRTPVPPLSVTLGSWWTPLGMLCGVGAGLVLCGVVALRSLRERYPVPAAVDLR
jgi:hypothetical protein